MCIKEENIKMRVTPEQSKQVQEICFGLGIYWAYGGATSKVSYLETPYIYIGRGKLYKTISISEYSYSPWLEVSADDFIKTKGFTENMTQEVKQESLTESQIEDLEQLGIDKVGLRKETAEEIKQENTSKNNFKEYGFEADFEGEIYEKYEVFDMEFFTGYVWEKPKEDYPNKRLLTWTKEGEPIHYHIAEEEQIRPYILNPIKKPWYETPNQFRLIMIRKSNGWYPNIFYSEDYLEVGISNMETTEGKIWRYATKEEIYSLYQGEENE